jgi:hypothetical protein
MRILRVLFVLPLTCVFATVASGQIKTTYDDDGAILVNSKRTLIIGTYHKPKSPDPYKELAETGFNLVHTGNSMEELDAAHAAGMMTWSGAGTIDPSKRDESKAAIEAAVKAVKDHPALAFLETVDEPAWTWMKAEPRQTAQQLAEAFPIIKAIDPNHLVYTNHAPTNLVKTLQAYNAGTDIVACDIYPVNPGGLKHSFALFEDGLQGDLNNEQISQVGEYTDKMRKVAGPNRPVFMVLQAFAWEALTPENERRDEKILYPTYDQNRFMAFQALIHGANGIVYWGSMTMPQPSTYWSDLKRAVREVADLGSALAERTAKLPISVDYHEVGQSVDDGVQWIAKEHGGKLLLFTCNADKYKCKATLSGLSGWASAKVLYEDRDLPIENGTITDTWKRFDVHIYELTR